MDGAHPVTDKFNTATVGAHSLGRPAMRDLAEEAQEQLLAAVSLTTDELQRLISLAGRNYGPSFLCDAYSEDKIKPETVTDLIGGIWSMAELPDRYLDRDDWRWLFSVAGFTVDGQPAPRPTEPIQLWRGSVPERKADWSWSTDRMIAEGYANGTAARRPKGRLYTVAASPEALLCANTERGEAEYVVDTRGLNIREVTTPGAV